LSTFVSNHDFVMSSTSFAIGFLTGYEWIGFLR